MKDTVSHYVPPHSPLTSTEPQVFSNNLTMPLLDTTGRTQRVVIGVGWLNFGVAQIDAFAVRRDGQDLLVRSRDSETT